MRVMARIFAATVVCSLFASACTRSADHATTGTGATNGQPVVQVGTEAPNFTLPSAQGPPVTLSSFAGHKPVLVYFSMGPG